MTVRGRRLVALALFVSVCAPIAAQEGEWLTVDYSQIVDRRELSHSSESVGVLLERLDGRPVPAPGERPSDRRDHALLDPLVEPYAFVLADAIDTLEGVADPPLVELGSLWLPGERQPVWAELLRSRRFMVESDGRGRLRVFVPLEDPPDSGAAVGDRTRKAYQAAWPVLRHVFAAEQARLGGNGEVPVNLRVTVYAYHHLPARSRFLLGSKPYEIEVAETRADGRRPPLDLKGLERFLEQGLQLEGGRLDPDGTLRVFGSAVRPVPSILGQPVSMADLAVAYRAVFHGGLAEPYMSLDRGLTPQTANVNYGGRLRDTRPGTVSLECDIRFKTFSLGIDIATGEDVRRRVRREIPGFKTHLERFSDHPDSAGIQAQQTRLWFYPDSVDLTVSPQLDVLAIRRARMSAASERVVSATSTTTAEDPPWTLETVGAINERYEAFASVFPELADLDQVVRMLSFFTWLRQAERAGLVVPDLDVLLTVELPQHHTPREYPQLLTFDALPEPGGEQTVVVYDRVAVGDALSRLDPRGRALLPARLRFERARAALDPSIGKEAELLADLDRYDPSETSDSLYDLLAYRAERLRMHRLVLATLGAERGGPLAEREQSGEQLRIFSVGIGGLDLGMGRVLDRAGGSSIRLASSWSADGPGASVALSAPSARAASGPRDEWKVASVVSAGALPPAHGSAADRMRWFVDSGIDPVVGRWVLTVTAPLDPEVRSRRVLLGDGRRAGRIERLEGARLTTYRLERRGATVVALAEPARAVEDGSPAEPSELPPGVVLVSVLPDPAHLAPTTRVRLQVATPAGPQRLEADFPRAVLQRLVLGRDLDLAFQPMPLAPLPPAMGAVEVVMFTLAPGSGSPPWVQPPNPVPGEDDPVRLARALNRWSSNGPPAEAASPAVIATDPVSSPRRWLGAPRPASGAVLLLPSDAFSAKQSVVRQSLVSLWRAGPVTEALPPRVDADLVVLVSDEPPGLCASRVARLAAEPAMRGKLLAAWCLSGAPRPDIAPALLGPSGVAGLGVAAAEPIDLRVVPGTLESWSRVLGQAAERAPRVEQLPGPFVWYF
jgi:hypothetical protein